MFIGRTEELKVLEGICKREGFYFLLAYGGRGTGKTTLFEEFCKDKDAILFTAKPSSSMSNLARFSSLVLSHFEDTRHERFSFWESALLYIKDKSRDKRFVIVLDEFAEIAERDSAFLSVLYNAIENELADSQIFLILTSSDAQFLKDSFLGKDPLAGKLSKIMRINTFLSDDTIEQLKREAMTRTKGLEHATFIKFSVDEVIIREGERYNEMYKIMSGTAVCSFNQGTKREFPLGVLKENSSIGEYSILTGKPALFTVTAYSDMLVMKVTRSDFSKFIRANVSNAYSLIKSMAKMLGTLKFHTASLIEELDSITKSDEQE